MAHDEIPEAYYYGDPYYRPSVGRQLREFLARQRDQGVTDFDLAYRQATRKVTHEHEARLRFEDKEMLADPLFRAAWEAAYLRQPHPVLDALRAMTAVLETEDVADALRRSYRGARAL
jgi:hypothetical protein